jgi:hypothetical protein
LHSSPFDPDGEDRLPWHDYDEIGEAGISSRLADRAAAAVDALEAVYAQALTVGNYEFDRQRRPGVLQVADRVCTQLEQMLDITPPPGSKRWG